MTDSHVKSNAEMRIRLTLLEEEAARAFGSAVLANQWITRKNLALGCTPESMMSSEEGLMEVRQILSAIEHGGVV